MSLTSNLTPGTRSALSSLIERVSAEVFQRPQPVEAFVHLFTEVAEAVESCFAHLFGHNENGEIVLLAIYPPASPVETARWQDNWKLLQAQSLPQQIGNSARLMPIRVGEALWGGFYVELKKPSETTFFALELISSGLGMALHLQQAHQTHISLQWQTARRTEELSLLLDLGQTLSDNLELSQIYRQVVEAVAKTFGYALVSLYTLEEGFLKMQHQVGYATFLEQIPSDQGTMSQAARTGKPVFIPDARAEPDFLYAVPGIASMVAVPLLARTKVHGVLCVESLEVPLSNEDARLIGSAVYQVSMAIERGLLLSSLVEQERLYRTLVETMPSCVTLYDGENYVYANPSALHRYGVSSLEELKRYTFTTFSQPGAPLSNERYAQVLRGEVIDREEDQLRSLQGDVIDFEASVHPVQIGDRTLGLVAWQDITERKRTEAALRRSEGLHRTLVQFSREVVEILDPQGTLLYASPNVAALGFDPEFWKSNAVNIFSYVPLEYQAGARELMDEVLQKTTTLGPVLMPLQHLGKPGEWTWFEISLENRLNDPDIAGIVLRARDVTEQKAYETAIRHMAYHDALTGLPNRRMFVERGEAQLDNSHRTRQPCALLYLDLDQFKSINDSLGHQAGDELLVKLSSRLHGCLREGDLLCRLGGDEFAVLLPNTEASIAAGVAARMRSAASESVWISGIQVVVSASIGISLFPQDGTTLEALMRVADQTMYRAKKTRGPQGLGQYQSDGTRGSEEWLDFKRDLQETPKNRVLEMEIDWRKKLCQAQWL